MKRSIYGCAMAFALAAGSAYAQDSTVKTKTTVDADDAKTVVMTGCLTHAPGGAFMLAGATTTTGGDLESKTKVKTDIDRDETKIETTAKTEIDDAKTVGAVGTSGQMAMYEVSARDGVDLASHVGHRVEIGAVKVAAGDGDADITIKDKTKVEADNAKDATSKTKIEAEIPRGDHPQLVAMSIKQVGSCAN